MKRHSLPAGWLTFAFLVGCLVLFLLFPVLALAMPALPGIPPDAIGTGTPPLDPGGIANGGPLDGTALALLLLHALQDGQWLLVTVLAVVGAVWVVRTFVKPYVPWLGTSRGGALLSLLVGQAAALANVLLEGHFTADKVVRGLIVAFMASGGWSFVKALLPTPPEPASPESTKNGAALVILALIVFAAGSAGCGHSLMPPRAHVALEAMSLTGSSTSALLADRLRRCRGYDNCFLVCSTAAPVFAALGAAGAGLPAIAHEMPESSRTALLLTGAISAALGAGAGVCSQACSARYADHCSALEDSPAGLDPAAWLQVQPPLAPVSVPGLPGVASVRRE